MRITAVGKSIISAVANIEAWLGLDSGYVWDDFGSPKAELYSYVCRDRPESVRRC